MAQLSEHIVPLPYAATMFPIIPNSSGYEVQFHILDKDTAHVHGQPVLPKELTQPRGLLASIEAARSSVHPIPFCIAFRNGSLPSHISESFMQGAMHTGTTYTVITVPYTDNYEEVGM